MVNISVIAKLCIHILTWNIGSHYPNDTSFSDILYLNGKTQCPDNKLPDMYVLGFEEIEVEDDNPWIPGAKEMLSDYGYFPLETKQMQNILINVWTKPEHQSHIQNLKTRKTRTGMGGWWGNKGAVSVRMNLYGTEVIFIAAHLAAHDEELEERIVDYNQIVDNHQFKDKKYRTIFDHDVVFWFGDLNFRLNGNDSALAVRDKVDLSNLDSLFAYDQLSMVRKAGTAFGLMNEQKPTFPPTFKFIEGTSEYDLKRRPAWCDRILYRVVKDKYPDMELELQQLSYKSHPQYTLSDHKPVTAEFLYTIKATTK